MTKKTDKNIMAMPLLPLRDTVLFPGLVTPLLVGRQASVEALNACSKSKEDQHRIFLVTQKDPEEEEPAVKDLYSVGVVGEILQMLQSDNGLYRIVVEAQVRARIVNVAFQDGYHKAEVQPIKSISTDSATELAMTRTLLDEFSAFTKYQDSESVHEGYANACALTDEPDKATDIIVGHALRNIKVKQKLLEEHSISKRLKSALTHVGKELSIMRIERRLRSRVQKQMEQSQREYYLNEHMKAIQQELGQMDGGELGEMEQMERKLRKADMPEHALKKAMGELNKLKMMAPVSAEASVLRGYLDWLISVPWVERDELTSDLRHARDILDKHHYGLEEIKERIMEYLAVQKRVKKNRGSIICLVGAPGVGKTSLGKSIASGTNRKYVRLSLGGVRDEAEIRGHRRTYIGAMPGKIVQKLSEAGTVNPLFLLDEVDKIDMDYRGDPASALLEVLDPEQNHSFSDHYLEVNYDLSEVLFVCTANTLNIPPPLLDRMEVVRIPGYTEHEKQTIAEKYLLPRQMEYAGLRKSELKMKSNAIRDLICQYTREAGVRSLERHIAKICRKVVLKHSLKQDAEPSTKTSVNKETKPLKACVTVGSTNLAKYCGVRKYDVNDTDKRNRVGQVYGLAWTEAGGELLTVESTTMPGKARQIVTGSLGKVMKESVNAAVTVVRARAQSLGIIDTRFFEETDFHVHVPEGATPKDGPSAGISICVALISSLTGIPVKHDVAMTGEITLQGRVLAIGGLKEKLLAARRANIKKVIIPERNTKDLKDMPDSTKEGLEIITVSWVDEILAHSLEKIPRKLSDRKVGKSSASRTPGNDTRRTPNIDKHEHIPGSMV
jgi:ATP-dependent Lon protease